MLFKLHFFFILPSFVCFLGLCKNNVVFDILSMPVHTYSIILNLFMCLEKGVKLSIAAD